jgi:hypothetical protein
LDMGETGICIAENPRFYQGSTGFHVQLR